MTDAITHYYKLTFRSADKARAAVDAIAHFALSPEGSWWLRGPHRLVVWADVALNLNTGILYVSPGALAILKRLVPTVPSGAIVDPSSLPGDRAQLIGGRSDWDVSGEATRAGVR